jgi:LuxR family maltose regulon positive regulatory protein
VTHSRARHPARTAQLAARLVDLLDHAPRRRLPAIESYRIIAANNIAIGQLWTGDLAAARSTLSTVESRAQAFGLGLVELSAQAHLAMLDAILGRVASAERRARAARTVAERRGWAREPQALGLHVAMALTHLQRNELAAAQREIDVGLRVSDSGSDAACRVALGIAGVGVAVMRRDRAVVGAAAARLASTEAAAGELPPMLLRWCAVARADAALVAVGPVAAIDRLDEVGDPSDLPGSLGRVVLAKAHLELNEPAVALALLEEITAASSPYLAAVVEAKLISAVAADRVHRDMAAMAAVTEAVDLAHAVGVIRPFLAVGPRIPALLVRHRHVVARHLDFTGSLCAAAAAGSAAGAGSAAAGGSSGGAGSAAGAAARAGVDPSTVEVLTEREHVVLEYLPTMFKSAEIASDLFVTVNTIKSHQQSIYRKLGVTTRREAVDRARELNLI